MGSSRNVTCPENEGLAMFLFRKREEMAKKETFTDRVDATLSKAYKNICDHKDPICNLKETSKIKGIGNWTLKLLKEYFDTNDDPYPSSQKVQEPRAKKIRVPSRYLPQKGSAPYAILITLYRFTSTDLILPAAWTKLDTHGSVANRATQDGKQFMLKRELTDAAEASGLSRMPIGPSKSGAPPGRFGSSVKDWYCGWSSMKTLISKGLVVKSSCPAK
eukprot:Gb_35211 [translate_table: standard]